ncbi:bisdemethoxycurcumin synthase [Brachypodium distachyon]|uniref:Chalcone synthase n=1 Tax=Brachypodium distachyon TaxID=15368 RepID=A0A0Q3K5K6_BRADI|nr:bisdemethoxycurcumin synthase [Brachypodium distachyon]KQK19828.1 hypothetical protein BRADI_1g50710v3 [Brachypodium distachyon]|eukprot:XP_014751759.1 bisdemethoxycurcumin synthase [Brachypodium distachyon]
MANISTPVSTIRAAQRADGPAAVLAIGTANPAHCVSQDDYPDYYFRITNSDHLTHLKHVFTKLCAAAGVEKRFFHHTEGLLKAHPELLLRRRGPSSSLDTRLDIVAAAAPELAASAAAKAIAEWGRPAADITHLVVSTNAGAHAPGCDARLATLLGLRRDVRRTVLQLNGCAAGCAALRLAKDMAENCRGARVLVACVELTVSAFRGPDEEGDSFESLIPQALFGDGAAAVIVGAIGADSDIIGNEHPPLFEMVSASQAVIPGTEGVLTMQLKNGGVIDGVISTELPRLAADNVERCLLEAFAAIGVDDGNMEWNDLFWAVHPGSTVILDHIDRALRLAPEKLAASRSVVRSYGNMLGATIIFVLDELRRQPLIMDHQWGVMMGFGPGFTVETMLLHAPATATNLNKLK